MTTPDPSHRQDEWITSPEFMRGALVTLVVGSFLSFLLIRWSAPEQTMRAFGPLGALVLAGVAWRVLAAKGVDSAKRVLGLGGLLYVLFLCFVVAGVLTPVVIALPVLLMMV
ncbi:MAG: hypothetical protein ACOVO0_05895, partial [Burkholderiaceae bacterium]